MFERYTEKSHRAIFFARYEASQYGSRRIEAEHLLLGVLREERYFAGRLFPAPGEIETLRKEIEAQLTRGPQISTSVEVPLSQESKRILDLAAESAKRLGHRYVECVHLILGMLRVDGCAAARLLQAHSVDENKVEVTISETHDAAAREIRGVNAEELRAARREELEKTVSQVVRLWAIRAGRLASLFAPEGQFGDSRGGLWSGTELEKGIEAQFAADHAAVPKVTLENIQSVSMGSAVVTLRMNLKGFASQRFVLVFRYFQMNWQIISAHISLLENVDPGPAGSAAR
jgi:hypothetical protein